MVRRRVLQTEHRFASARAAHASPLAALHEAFVAEMDQIGEPKQIANAFSAYTDNIDDPEISGAFAQELAAMERHIGELLAEAVAVGEVTVPVTPQLVSAVLAATEGTMLVWAIIPRGDVKDRIHDAVEGVLGRSGG
jgi:hypothetical protein